MNDNEFDILDELYFVTSYADLRSALALPEEQLQIGLEELVRQGYAKMYYPDPDTEKEYDPVTFGSQCHTYSFLATKSGLLMHNSL